MANTEPPSISLRRGAALLEVAPAAGGAVTRYALESDDGDIDWLRSATPDVLRARTPTGMACFPLVPFSNRVGYGCFSFGGRVIELPPNFPPEPHAIHGHGWRAEWRVVERDPHSVAVEYRHPGDAWPFPYRARQTLRLEPEGLHARMEVTNEGEEPMPVGFGWHPYFVRTSRTRVTASVERVWLTGADLLPERLAAVPDEWRLDGGLRPDDVALDNNFDGWDGRARIDWPERGAFLELEADGPFRVLVVYTPPGEDYVCVEPATSCIDAFNLAAAGCGDTGMLVVEPGGSVSGSIRMRPVVDG